jgi:hypothetical protein
MSSFPHTLIGLGPFANQGCKIVFYKTSVTVYHPNGHPILNGWWDMNAPDFGSSPSLLLLHLQRTCHLWLQ